MATRSERFEKIFERASLEDVSNEALLFDDVCCREIVPEHVVADSVREKIRYLRTDDWELTLEKWLVRTLLSRSMSRTLPEDNKSFLQDFNDAKTDNDAVETMRKNKDCWSTILPNTLKFLILHYDISSVEYNDYFEMYPDEKQKFDQMKDEINDAELFVGEMADKIFCHELTNAFDLHYIDDQIGEAMEDRAAQFCFPVGFHKMESVPPPLKFIDRQPSKELVKFRQFIEKYPVPFLCLCHESIEDGLTRNEIARNMPKTVEQWNIQSTTFKCVK